MKLIRAYVDRDDRSRSYLDLRVALPRTRKQRRTARNWRKFSKTLPSGTNVTQVMRLPKITSATTPEASPKSVSNLPPTATEDT